MNDKEIEDFLKAFANTQRCLNRPHLAADLASIADRFAELLETEREREAFLNLNSPFRHEP